MRTADGVNLLCAATGGFVFNIANVLLIAGTSSVAHLRENVAAASLSLDKETVAELDEIGG